MKYLRPIGIILVFLSYFCFLFSRQVDAKSGLALQFYLSFDKNEYKTNEPIYMNFKLKNKGNKQVYVNKRFYVNSEDSKPQEREVFLRIIGPLGEKLPSKPAYDTGFPKTDNFVLLKPQEEVTSERKKNLKAYFDLKTPGKYKVIAIYQNIYGPEIGVDAFKDKITSEPVTIKIVEPK